MKTKTYLLAPNSQKKLFKIASILVLLTMLASLVPNVKAAADVVTPSDVEGVKATSAEGAVVLKWNAATDNVGVTGYKIYYGTKSVGVDGAKYDLAPVDAGNKLTHTVDKLANGVTYYFAVTAYDAVKNESENYSAEVSATPGHGASDAEAPKVAKALAVTNQTVKVTFSESVSLPTTTPEAAFLIKNDATQAALEIKKAEIDKTDTSGQTVLLTTGVQKAGATYIVTAGIQIKDLSNNPIVSGTSDTAVFTGTDIAPPPVVATQQTQTQAVTLPEMVKVDVKDATHVLIYFSKELDASPTALNKENFIITEADNTDKIIDAKGLTNAVVSGKTIVTLETATPLAAKSYNLIAVDIKDKQGNLISVDRNATVFEVKSTIIPATQQSQTQQTQSPVTQQSQTQQTQGADTEAPEDAKNFVAKAIEKVLVTLTWSASLNKAGDLANYMLYRSTDGVQFDAGVVLDPKAVSYDLSDLVPGMKYFFKLTARDVNGNESKGITTSFTLPATGPELGLLVLGSLGLSRLMRKKKAKK